MIGGNTCGTLQRRVSEPNAIREQSETWTTYTTLFGWVDLMSGTSERMAFNAKTQDSTHIFICEYCPIDQSAADARMQINDQIYDVLLIDNPMGMNRHLEIYLRYTGV